MERICVNGVELEVDIHGSGEPVLLVRDGRLGVESARPELEPALTDRYRIIDYQRRDSASGPTVASGVADAKALLDELGIARAHVLARSLGAATSIRLALDHPGIVHTLALIEPAVDDQAMKPTGERITQPTLSVVDRQSIQNAQQANEILKEWGSHAETVAAPLADSGGTAQAIAAWLAKHPMHDATEMQAARYASTSGVFWVAGVIASFAIARLGPGPGSKPEDFANYFSDSRSRVLAGTYVRSVAVLCGYPFVVHVCDMIRQAEGGSSWLATVALAGASAGNTMAIAGNAFHGVAAFNADNISPELAQTLFYLGSVYYMAALGLVPFLLAVGASVLRTGILPRWMGWLPLLDAPVLLVGRLPIQARGWELFDAVGFVSFLVWVLAVSRKLRQEGAVSSAPRPRRRRWKPSRRTLAIAGLAAGAVLAGAAARR